MTAEISEWFGAAADDPVVAFVLLGIIFLFLCGWWEKIPRPTAAALMTSLGILGTFVGIYKALSAFAEGGGISPQQDITELTESINGLLNGMYTAFFTSLLGLGSAFISKILWSWQSKNSPTPTPSPEQKQILEHLDAIKRAIAGDDDSSMVSQIKNLRTDTNDGFKKMDGLAETIRVALVDNLQNLMADLREIIGRQLGEQLQQLIANIEEALIKQFGKTFVEFNEAVQALKKWQEEHKQQVERLTAAFDESAKSIEKIRAECEAIPATMEKLRVVVESAATHTENLAIHLEAFADMKKQAQESFPTIKENLDKIGNDLASSTKGFGEMEATIKAAFAASKQETENIVKQHANEIQTMLGGMTATMTQAQRDMANKINGTVQEASDKFAKEINAEIDRLTKTWGDNMVGIAERCGEIMKAVEQSAANRQ